MAATTTASNQSGSKRWTHFHSALQLAIQRAAHKWTYEDFGECFSLWCDEQPDGASVVFNTISRHMEKHIVENCEDLFAEYNLQHNIDILHAVVTEARTRKQQYILQQQQQAVKDVEVGKDVWRKDLHPRTAARARTVPLLEKEAGRLRATLEEMENQNINLQSQIQKNVKERKETDDKTTELLDILDEVYEKWSKLPLDEIEMWTVQTVEASGPPRPP
ncbi:hypothetical protein PILCRDRAFT_819948 [Piloderma croceum F 1598]|uniref:Uncharacterized protein n=1 Tax=Piloderma croceum (strain F 1598) TaxID=765440 RepID=A0A0C3C0T2_PILCF|nr:hypothetical protein PILCRDRAFT_819948 [Piloderma croceum F 1598]